jgi:HK97 family phage portal protein
MRFPSRGSGLYHAQGFTSWADDLLSRFKGSQINYAAEVGDLHQSSLVMTAVNWAGTRLSEAVPKVYDRDGEGKYQEVLDHELTQLLENPNPYYDDADMAEHFAFNDILDGNVFWRKIKDGRGRVLQLWPIPFWLITPRWNEKDPTDFISWYEYKVNQKSEFIPADEIVHFAQKRGCNPQNDRRGLSPLGSLLREIYSDNEVSNFAAALMKNGGIPDFILSPADGVGATGLSPQEQEFIKKEFQDKRTGDNRGKAILATRGVKVEKLTFEPDKLDLSALRRVPESRLASVLQIPASALGLFVGIENNTYSNAKELGEDATEGFLVPRWKRMGKTITRQLGPDFNFKPGQKMMYDTSEVRALQEDKTDLVKRNSIAFTAGWMKRSECRADAGLKVDETLDDVYMTDIKAEQQAAQAEMLAQRQPPDSAIAKYINGLDHFMPSVNERDKMRLAWRRYAPKEARNLYRGNGHG